ncbi:MAG: HPr family phosphocarrier protein [Acidobacteriota bacterium]
MQERTVKIKNRLGLHARAAARFVQCAAQFTSKVQLQRDDKEEIANGKSILDVLMLAASNGTTLIIQTDGADEERAADALVKIVEDRFGEEVSDGLF